MKQYEAPEIDVLYFKSEDVITASGGFDTPIIDGIDDDEIGF